jgi:hypothetical protein
LQTRLSGDGRSAKDIQDEAEALGISERTLYRARKKLGVRAEKDSYAEGWRLHLDKEAPGWRNRAGGDSPPEAHRQQFQIIGPEAVHPCAQCGKNDGQVFLIKDPFRGAESHPLHEQCAPKFYRREE